ncbi:hypothetical protein FQR65_LT11956 [Abscondita terminalis]|nr:hypothetical protein FQR65_LT11956 [Abscondita terminalis]
MVFPNRSFYVIGTLSTRGNQSNRNRSLEAPRVLVFIQIVIEITDSIVKMILLIAILCAPHVIALPPSCDSPVYCYGDVLHAVQMARVFDDGKTFVDLKMKHSQDVVLENFARLQNPTKEEIVQFVNDNFERGNELENHTLIDFNPDLPWIQEISNETVRTFTKDLLNIWPQLARKVKSEVFDNVDRYSFIPVPNAFVIPGGRFLEYYYWDSYWIVEGLLISEMYETARGMIDNFISIVDKYGFIPNGGRIYYLQRSQPPLLTPMAFLYLQHTKDTAWVKNNIRILEKELEYWKRQSLPVSVNGQISYTMYHYDAPSDGPRPESYREDYLTANYWDDEAKREEVYVDLKSGAESGWDFSARWVFDDKGGNVANLSHIQTRRVVPVDLNAFLCGAYRDIAEMYAVLGKFRAHHKWYNKYLALREAIDVVLWNEDDGIWYDYDVNESKHRKMFYPSNVTPLWSKCFYPDRVNIKNVLNR